VGRGNLKARLLSSIVGGGKTGGMCLRRMKHSGWLVRDSAGEGQYGETLVEGKGCKKWFAVRCKLMNLFF
jgi:hypothetical protein